MLGPEYLLAPASPSAPGGLRGISVAPSGCLWEGLSLSFSLSGCVSSSPALLPDTVLANLETSARVTSLLILLQENLYEYSDRRTDINPHSNLQITSLPWGPLLSGFQFQWKLSVISFSGLEISPGR